MCAVLITGCGSEGAVEERDPGPEPVVEVCSVGDVTLPDGTCLPPGLTATECADGFAFDEQGGCAPVLPSEPCEDGTTALPGDAACRPLAACGDDPWGFVAGEAGPVVHVDGATTSATSDGSVAAPFATISAAVAAAPPGAVVAVAAGEYAGALTLGDSPVTLWGRCPSMVTLSVASGAAITIQGGAAVTVRGLAITGAGSGVAIGAAEARLEDLWIHDLGGIGVNAVTGITTPSRVTISDVHVARVVDVGVLGLGAEVVANDVVVRDVALTSDGRFGRGWDVEAHMGQSAALTLDGAVVDRTIEHGVYVSGSAAEVRRLVVRDVAYNTPIDPGPGVTARGNDAGVRSVLSLSDAVIERSSQSGIYVAGSDAAIARLVVRDIVTDPSGTSGEGIVTTTSPNSGVPTLEVRRALVERTTALGVFTIGPALVEGVWIRDVAPEVATGWFGRGQNSQADITAPAELTLRNSRIERVNDVAVAVFNGDGLVDNVAVAVVAPSIGDGAFGDGIAAFSGTFSAVVEIHGSEVREATRAGVGAFAAAVAMADTRLICNGIDLNGEDGTVPHRFDDLGGNVCGCEQEEACKVLSTSLAPPGLPETPEL